VHSFPVTFFRQDIDNEMQGRIWSPISFFPARHAYGFWYRGASAGHVFNPPMAGTGHSAEKIEIIVTAGVTMGSGEMVIMCGFLSLLFSFFIAPKRGVGECLSSGFWVWNFILATA
jgi:hypothetical protein